jgi:hypothetical protein
MKSVPLVCLFAVLIGILAVAQSNRSPAVDPFGRTVAQEPQPGVPPNPTLMPQRAPFAQREARASKKAAPQLGAPPSSALNFAPAVTYGSGGYLAFSVAVSDVNGDGKPDLVIANYSACSTCTTGVVSVLLGNGDGTFQTASTYETVYGASSLSVADLNGDGKPDIVVSSICNGCEGTVSVLLGNGDGSFQQQASYGSGGMYPYSVTVADVNGDGKPDVLVANDCDANGDCLGIGILGVLLGNGDGTFQTAVTYGSGGSPAENLFTTWVAVADLNGDGKPDVLVANNYGGSSSDGAVGVLLGNGDGTFKAAVSYSSGANWADSVAVADVNGDGKPDLLVTNWCSDLNFGECFTNPKLGVLLGNGDGTFQTVVIYDTGGDKAQSVAVADVNGDGKPDALVANFGSDTVGVLLGNGDGTFQTSVTFGSGGVNALSVVAADVNGDGKPDLLLANHCVNSISCANGTVSVLINTSTTATTTTLASSPNPSNFGEAASFTSTVTAQQGFYKGTPTGTVSFLDGTANIGNSSLNNSGVAVFSISTLSVGTHSITASYQGDANFAPSTSPVLQQIVQGAVVLLSPPNLNFGNETVGIPSVPQVSTLTNTGNIALTVTSTAITGANSSDFGAKSTCPTSLGPGSSCSITATFTPSATGTRTAALTITDNAAGSPQALSFTGIGVSPTVTFSPTSLTFATQLVFTQSNAQTVSLTNTGLGILTIASISASGQFAETNTCGATVNPGASCTISVTFNPKSKGSLTGSISVTDNAPGSPQKVTLTGIGTYIQLAPTSLNFGTQPVGTKSLPKKITVTNKGSAAVSISGVSITGTNAGDFAIGSNTCGASLASGASCFVKVTFTPSARGKRTANVSVSDNGGGSPQKVSLTGTGT